MPSHESIRLRVFMLGPWRVLVDGEPAAAPKRRDTERLWAYLLTQDGTLERAQVADVLWPNDNRARPKMRIALNDLKAHLKKIAGDGDWIEADRNSIAWPRESECQVDLWEVQAAVSSQEHGQLDEALELAREPLLEGWLEDWVLPLRTQLEHRILEVLRAEAERLSGTGRSTAALELAERALAQNPLDEASHQLIMRIHLQAGDRAAAMRAFMECQSLLRDELDCEPDLETQELAETIRIAEVGLAAPKQSVVQFRPPPLPEPDTEMVDQLGRVDAVLARLEEAPLLTITGGPGIGKSRLALEAAQRWRAVDEAEREIWYYSAAGLPAGASMASAIGAAFLHDRGRIEGSDAGQLAEEWLRIFSRGEGMLLIDDVDHHLDELARLAMALLEHEPLPKILTTSREPVAIAAERVWPVPVLAAEEARMLWASLHGAFAQRHKAQADRLNDLSGFVEISDGFPIAIRLASLAAESLAMSNGEPGAVVEDALLRAKDAEAVPDHHRSLNRLVTWSSGKLSAHQLNALIRMSEGPTIGQVGSDDLDLIRILSEQSWIAVGRGQDHECRVPAWLKIALR